MDIKGVLFDFMGTTVIEKDPQTIHQCFLEAFVNYGVPVTDEMIRKNRGKDKKEMIASVLDHYTMPLELVPFILESFNNRLVDKLDNFQANEGVSGIIQFLKEKNIIIGLGSGFPRDIFDLIFHHLGWAVIGFDYIGIAGEIGRGRPHPDMIIDMMKRFSLSAGSILKVGDTIADIMEGKNAGVKTVAILSGTQNENEIRSYQPDFVITKLGQLKDIVIG